MQLVLEWGGFLANPNKVWQLQKEKHPQQIRSLNGTRAFLGFVGSKKR